ncbi:MAG TPA: ATP12 family protein [Caulobacteraceae bacterium]|jgi:chaperone required for assembly of F1-ATPase
MAGKLAPPIEPPRRFYKAVSTGEAADGIGIFLDGKPIRTPAGKALTLPDPRLADMLAREWDAQATHIEIARMPATRLAFTAIDFVGEARDGMAAEIGRYAGADAVCYFADGPELLVERQTRRWGAVIEWAELALGVKFVRVTGIRHEEQHAVTLLRLARLAEEENDFGLAGLGHATALFGSAILAFALQRGELDGQAALDLSRLDELFQQERWGVDEEAAERAANMQAEALMLEQWFAGLRPG